MNSSTQFNNISFCDKKYLITNTIQELYDEYNILQASHSKFVTDFEIEKKSFILTIKKQEVESSRKDFTINQCEVDLSKQKIQINEYEKMIRDLEDKLNEALTEKEEVNRFDIIRNQAKEIQSKEQEIIRLTKTLEKGGATRNKIENKILAVIDAVDDTIAGDNLKTTVVEDVGGSLGIDEEVVEVVEVVGVGSSVGVEDVSDEEDYEILIYRKKEYWINKNSALSHVYEVLEGDALGDKIGVYITSNTGKLKVVIDKK